MTQWNLAIAGLGNVGRALVALLARKRVELERLGVAYRITGVASRRLGWVAHAEGLDEAALLRGEAGRANAADVAEWLAAARADVLFECTPLARRTGEPATSHLRAALEHGAHAISANKGPVVHALDELSALAAARGKRFLFESAVMDGAPVFNLFRECMPAVEVRSIRGVLNSTTNVILEAMELGASFEEGVARARELGVAEADPSDDVDGWDGAVKIAALARVLMGAAPRLEEIERAGIRELTASDVAAARAERRVYKLVCRAERRDGTVVASVRPEALEAGDPLALVRGTSSAVYFRTDVCPEIGIVETDPGLETTAYGLLSDFLRAARRND